MRLGRSRRLLIYIAYIYEAGRVGPGLHLNKVDDGIKIFYTFLHLWNISLKTSIVSIPVLYSRDFFFSLGLIRMTSPATVMIPQGGNVSSSMMAPGPNSELQPRTPRPASQSGIDLQPLRTEEAALPAQSIIEFSSLSDARFLTAQLKCCSLYKICLSFFKLEVIISFSKFLLRVSHYSYQLYPNIPKNVFRSLLNPAPP